MEVLPADLNQRLAAAARAAPLLARAARERRRAAERRALLLYRPAVEQQLAAAERRLRPLRLMVLGRAVGLLALPAILITSLMGVAPPANPNLVDVGLPYTLLSIALLTMALWPYAFRPYMLLTRAFLLRALLTYALMEEAGQTGDLLIRLVLSQAREEARAGCQGHSVLGNTLSPDETTATRRRSCSTSCSAPGCSVPAAHLTASSVSAAAGYRDLCRSAPSAPPAPGC